jgi:hypothetical protein
MSGPADRLCFELLELAKAQQSALEEGKTDLALELMGKRQRIVGDMRIIDARLRLGEVMESILSVDAEIGRLLRKDLEVITNKLEAIGKMRSLSRDACRFNGNGLGGGGVAKTEFC